MNVSRFSSSSIPSSPLTFPPFLAPYSFLSSFLLPLTFSSLVLLFLFSLSLSLPSLSPLLFPFFPPSLSFHPPPSTLPFHSLLFSSSSLFSLFSFLSPLSLLFSRGRALTKKLRCLLSFSGDLNDRHGRGNLVFGMYPHATYMCMYIYSLLMREHRQYMWGTRIPFSAFYLSLKTSHHADTKSHAPSEKYILGVCTCVYVCSVSI